MSLIVSTFHRDPITKAVILTPPFKKPGRDLAGFESWRMGVWGSKAIINQGAIFLPQLATHDLYVEHVDLKKFKIECETLARSIDIWAKEFGSDQKSIQHRLTNILLAIDEAMKMKGGVYIG